MPEQSPTLDALVKILTAINGTLPILHGLLENEMATAGLTREERYQLRKSLIAETRAISDDLQSDREDI